jgi:hypothetical protein
MKVLVEKITGIDLMRRFCGTTMGPGVKSLATLGSMYACEHSPIQTQMFVIELVGVKTFISVHLVRHKIGISHYVQSMRDDRRIKTEEFIADRNTPLEHGLFLNAQAMIFISRKRLCYKSHSETVAAWTRVVKAVRKVDPELAPMLVPECVYRNGLCPERTMCKMGLRKVLSMYDPWPGHRVYEVAA